MDVLDSLRTGQGLGQLRPRAAVRLPRRCPSRHRGATRGRARTAACRRFSWTGDQHHGIRARTRPADRQGLRLRTRRGQAVVAKRRAPRQEKANLDAAVDAVDAVCVGNEIIQKGIADHDRLVRELDEARERFGVPVTTGFQPPDWQYFPDLATSVGDFSFLNVHPWWVLHRNDPLTAANWVAEAYQLVAGTPGIPADRVVVVQETSFPSGAAPPRRPRAPHPRTRSASTRRCWPRTSRSSGFSLSTRQCTARRPHPVASGACGTSTGNPSPWSNSSRQPYRAPPPATFCRAPIAQLHALRAMTCRANVTASRAVGPPYTLDRDNTRSCDRVRKLAAKSLCLTVRSDRGCEGLK